MSIETNLNTSLTPDVCMICGTRNVSNAMQCVECFAPMAIVHDAIAQDRDPRLISVIGESNVGKTVFLGVLLDMLAQRAGDFQAIPKGAYSVDLQQTVISHLAHRMFPPKTPMEANQWYWAYYQVLSRQSEQWVDLVMPDMAGESLAAEVANPETFRVIHNLINKSQGLLMLVDAAMAAEGSTQPDFFAMKMLSYIDSITRTQRDCAVEVPIAVVLCKADHCPECFDDPEAFVEANLNRLWNLCENRFERISYFAASVVGSLGYAYNEAEDYVTPVPLHTALTGILEPFDWILRNLKPEMVA